MDVKTSLLTICLVAGTVLFQATTCETPPPGPPDAGLYHTYDEIVTELQQLQSNFPAISQIQELGTSIENRKILAMKISDNAAVGMGDSLVRV